MVERSLCMREVGGSIPSASTDFHTLLFLNTHCAAVMCSIALRSNIVCCHTRYAQHYSAFFFGHDVGTWAHMPGRVSWHSCHQAQRQRPRVHCRPARIGRQEQDRQQATGRGQRHRPLGVFLEEADFEAKVDIVAEDAGRIGILEGTQALQGSQWACPSMSAPNGTSVQHTAQGEIHYAWTQHSPHLSVQKRHCHQGAAFLELERLCKCPIEVAVYGALSRARHFL